MTLVLAAVFAFSVPVFVDSREYTAAVHNYAKNPTPENDAVLARETAKYRRGALVTHLAAGAALFLFINLGCSLLVRRPAPDALPQ
jgi:hypothetical protein